MVKKLYGECQDFAGSERPAPKLIHPWLSGCFSTILRKHHVRRGALNSQSLLHGTSSPCHFIAQIEDGGGLQDLSLSVCWVTTCISPLLRIAQQQLKAATVLINWLVQDSPRLEQ